MSSKPPKLSGHAFISYVREDSRQVDQLQRMLEAAGIPVWRDTADLWPGDDWRARIRHAIADNALVFIACFSRSSLTRSKTYQNEEVVLAIEQLRLRRPDDPWLIPVRFDECEIPDHEIGGGRTLASIQRADLFGNSAKEGTARLVAAVRRILQKTSDSSPAFQGGEGRNRRMGDMRNSAESAPQGRRYAVNDRADNERLREELARARFLSKLRPRFRHASGKEHGYDPASVDRYLEAIRSLVVRDRTSLQAYIATTPNSFPKLKGTGYSSLSVDVYMVKLKSALNEYAAEASTVRDKDNSPPLVVDEVHRQMEKARLNLLTKLEPRIRHADGKEHGYDEAAVNRYLESMRSLAMQDMVDLLAHIATTSRAFPNVRRGGYASLSLDVFLNRLDEAVKQYVEEISAIINGSE